MAIELVEKETPAAPADSNGKNPGTDEAVTEQADLGAGVGPGEDFDQVEKEPEEETDATPAPPDPTKGMSQSEAMAYWTKKANHFESEYKVERAKRQSYDKRYGGLNGHGMILKNNVEQQRAVDRFTNLDVPNNVNDLASYTRYILNEAEKSFEHKMTEKQLDGRVETTEKSARDAHNGEDGLPAYDELVDEFVAPLIQKKPRIFNMLRELEDPAEAAYTLGFILKYKNFSDIVKSQTRDELMKNINATSKQAANVKGKANGRQPSGRLTRAEIDAMSPEDFERELERFRSGAE
jgi:hypothetical protein